MNQYVIDEKWLVLLATSLAGITIAIDFTIVNASLTAMQQELHASVMQLQWVIAGFGIFFGSLLVLFGRLGDLLGHKKVMISSMLGFMFVSLAAGLSPNPSVLIIMRMLQGIFGAAILPCGTALTSHAFKASEQGKALGLYGTIVGIGLATGPVLGAIIDSLLSWRWIFFINIPIMSISLFLCLVILKKSIIKSISID